MTFNGENISYNTPALLYFIMETTKTASTKLFTHRITQWLKTIVKKWMPLFELPLRWVGVRKSTPTTLKMVSTPWEKYEQSTDTLVECERWKNTQYITDWKKGQSLWDTSTVSSKPTHEDIEVQLVFLVGVSARSVKCVMRKTDWLLLSGVLDGSMDSYKVTTGKSGKPTELEKSLSLATKENEDNNQPVSERGKFQKSVQEGDIRTQTERILVFHRVSGEIFHTAKKFADAISKASKRRKRKVRSSKSKD